MNKFFLSLFLGGSMLMTASAAVSTPVYFFEDFNSAAGIPDGWIQYGVDAQPTGEYAKYFTDYSSSDTYRPIEFGLVKVAACSPSEFEGGKNSDQWLITPEITIQDAEVLLTYSVTVTGNKSKNKFKVLLSEGGTAKEDFTISIVNSSVTGKGTEYNTSSKRSVIEGYNGKTVRLAFVNYENSAGMVGFGDIKLCQYDLSIDELALENIIVDDNPFNPTFSFRLSTPTSAPGLTAELITDNGYTGTFTNTYSFGSGLASSCTVEFPEAFTIDRPKVAYNLTVTPNFEGARPTVIEGYFIRAAYEGVAVMEEYTGTWCQNCPRGLAFMAYYNDNFARKEGKGKFIGISYHSSDPMQSYVLNEIQAICPTPGYPYSYVNRKLKGDPTEVDVKAVMNSKTFADARISRVDIDGKKVSVDYAAAICFDSSDPGINVLAYVVENDIRKNEEGYSQSDIIGKYDDSYVINNWGEELLPYFAPYINLGMNIVPADKMVYNDVARGAYPSVMGSPVEGAFETCVYRTGQIYFEMPSTVLKPENVDVILLLVNGRTAEIVAGDAVGYDRFNETVFEVPDGPVYPEGYDPSTPGDSVADVLNEAILSFNEGILTVNSAEAGTITIYGADGLLISSENVAPGVSTHAIDSDGLIIIRLTTASGNRVAKFIK